MNDSAGQLARVRHALGIARTLAAEYPRLAWLQRIAIGFLEKREAELIGQGYADALRGATEAERIGRIAADVGRELAAQRRMN